MCSYIGVLSDAEEMMWISPVHLFSATCKCTLKNRCYKDFIVTYRFYSTGLGLWKLIVFNNDMVKPSTLHSSSVIMCIHVYLLIFLAELLKDSCLCPCRLPYVWVPKWGLWSSSLKSNWEYIHLTKWLCVTSFQQNIWFSDK